VGEKCSGVVHHYRMVKCLLIALSSFEVDSSASWHKLVVD